MNPVWTYNDRGYYSIAFVGKYKPAKIKTLPLDSRLYFPLPPFYQDIWIGHPSSKYSILQKSGKTDTTVSQIHMII